ncbi:MAG: hypothetical protein HY262_01160 [Chloroflexi bacterium]|nr:hypothetical protein [Chloroflexota bacterium]
MNARGLGRVLGLLALVLIVAGCARGGPGGTASPSASPGPGDLAYTCGRFPFSPALMTAPQGHDELLDNPAAAALRAHVSASGPDIDFLPDSGWTMTGMDATGAEFVTVGGDLGMKSVSVSNGASGWKVDGWGDCRPQLVLPDGIGIATWTWGGPGSPGPTTQTFDALVTELNCAGGRSADGRILGPQIVASDAAVLVIFTVRALGGTQACPSNPATRVRVDLGVALGNRTLFDGGLLPLHDPTKPIP